MPAGHGLIPTQTERRECGSRAWLSDTSGACFVRTKCGCTPPQLESSEQREAVMRLAHKRRCGGPGAACVDFAHWGSKKTMHGSRSRRMNRHSDAGIDLRLSAALELPYSCRVQSAKLAAFQTAGGSMNSDTSHPNALSLSVPMTRSLERLLTRAAMDRSQSAQELAKRIIRDWLLKEGGIALGSGPVRAASGGRQEP